MTEPAIRVLVVDDDPLQLELVERALSRDGFEVRGVFTAEALAAEARTMSPDLVLIDVNLPDAEGDRIVAITRDAAPGARVLLYSGWEDSKLRALAIELGADGFISKSESVVGIGRKLRELHKR